ncbi:ABC transporter substrate-binding protein [Streptomyces sp. RKAG293]|uniref:heme/hemin ABC transporter substrate-binding protein n=1 Tax=Streptomyces sp. RKAG293 TaxID=2893403 RepID=UPI002033FF17|nr:ABC transporter substrate-binding protein [Streptomyces sp. RKAG293]MCM2419041.1 ABC transporter substrate-binding protein [Streptomyces sp. RKAG293]
MRIWRISRLAGPLLLAVALTACGAQSGTGGPAAAAGAPAPAADRVEPLATVPVPRLPATVRSVDGRSVTVGSADRIVPLTGGLSEIVFTLGLGKNVVARDITATFAQAAKLPVITRAHDVSAEGVLSLHPTVVLADTSTGPAEAVQQIRAAGIPLIVFGTATRLGDVGPRIDAVAAALGVKASGDELRRRTADRMAAVTRTVPAPARGRKLKVAFLYLRGTASVYLLGGAGSGADSLIEAVGAVDAGKDSGLAKDFTPITSEALVKAAPDVILVMTKGLESVGGADGLEKVPGVAQTPAGMDRRVIAIDDGTLLNFGPRTDRVLRQLADGIKASGSTAAGAQR